MKSKPTWSIIHLKEAIYPRDFEFKPYALADAFSAQGLPVGLCLGSKSGYRLTHPGNQFVPNANVFCRKEGKIWWGDLDLARDRPKLEAIARKLRTRLYVLSESDGRFANADLQHSKVVSLAIWRTGGKK
jgi:hypothetical protein